MSIPERRDGGGSGTHAPLGKGPYVGRVSRLTYGGVVLPLNVAEYVSSYEANEVLTPTVPKQQWRPVSENELAYTAASAQCWVHA